MREKIRKILRESYYDSNKLYSKSYILNVLRNAPKHIKEIGYNLEEIECLDKRGDLKICVKIPEFLHVYITGRY